jgi:hypothetical protein
MHSHAMAMASSNNLRQIAIAMMMYNEEHGTLPPAYVASKDGKPLLSWRVLLLPYFGQKPLFDQFHMDEPWNSRHNAGLSAQMPPIYRSQAVAMAPDKTAYLTIRGPKTLFPGEEGVKLSNVRHPSDTILMVEVGHERAVTWTQPADYQPDPKRPAEGLLGPGQLSFWAAKADGSVGTVGGNPVTVAEMFDRH